MSETNRRPLTSRNTAWARGLSRFLVERKVSPNAVSVAGMVFATFGALCYAAVPRLPGIAWLLLLGGAVGVQLRLLCNLMDGLVAVEGGLKTRGGDLFNEAPDRYEDVVLLVGAGLATGTPALGWCAACAAVLTAYVRAFGASLGQGQDFCGPFAKPHRMFFLTIGSLAGMAHLPALAWALWLVALGAFFTAARRVVRLYAKLP